LVDSSLFANPVWIPARGLVGQPKPGLIGLLLMPNATLLAQIPVVPLAPAPIRPVGGQPDANPLLANAGWFSVGTALVLVLLVLAKLRSGGSPDQQPSRWTIWSRGPQVKPVRDPKYFHLITQAEPQPLQKPVEKLQD
jgi:hypothetical protein